MTRTATVEDIPALVRLGLAFRETSMYRELPCGPQEMAALCERLLTSSASTILVAESHEQVIGMIGLVAFTHHMTGLLTVGEVFWFVDTAHRGRGLSLLRAAETWARTQGARSLQMIAPTEQADGLDRVYRRFGYRPIEVSYEKAL